MMSGYKRGMGQPWLSGKLLLLLLLLPVMAST